MLSRDRQPGMLDPVLRPLTVLLEAAAAVMLVAICLIVFAGVFFRYFLHIGLGWTDEAARFLQIWMAFVGATVAVRRWSHFQLVIINRFVPERIRRAASFVAVSMVIALALVMVRNGFDITMVAWDQRSPVMGWNMGLVYVIVPVSGALMIAFAIPHLLKALRGEPLTAEAHGVEPSATDVAAARGE